MAEDDAKSDEKAAAETEEGQGREEGVRTTVTREGGCTCVIRVEADADYLRERYDEEVESIRSELAFPGFRRGRTPRALLERKMAGAIKTQVLAAVVKEGFDKAVRENDLHVVAELESPDVENLEWEAGQPGEFEFKCEILPGIELEDRDYKGVRVEVPALEVTPEMVSEELQRFASQFKSWEKTEEAGIDWEDRVECKVTAFEQEGEAARWSSRVEFVPREERLGPFTVEGLRGRLLDAGAGDVVKLSARCLREEAERIEELRDLAGQEVAIEVEIEAVYRERTPELDEEFARKFNLDSVDQIHRMLREKLERDVERQKTAWTDFMIIGTIIERVVPELPPSIVERAAREEERRAATRALRQGRSVDEAQRAAEEMAMRSRDVAERNLRAAQVLKEIAERERIYVSESEVQEQIRAIAAREGWTDRKAEKFLEQQDMLGSLRAEMREMKTRVFLRENASVAEIDLELFEQRYGDRFPQQQRSGRIEVAG